MNSNEQYIKWFLEVSNQEYNGNNKIFKSNIELNNYIEGTRRWEKLVLIKF